VVKITDSLYLCLCLCLCLPLYMHVSLCMCLYTCMCVCVYLDTCMSIALSHYFPYTLTLTSDRVHLGVRARTCVAPSQSLYVSNTHCPCPTTSPIKPKTIPASSISKKGPHLAKNMFKFSQVRALVTPCVQKKNVQ
jgi:hypothetical protein